MATRCLINYFRYSILFRNNRPLTQLQNETLRWISPLCTTSKDGFSQVDEESDTKNEKEEVFELQKQHDALLDRYQRSIAENDNMRKRFMRQIEDAKLFGLQSFCKDLLEVSDVLNRAVSSINSEDVERESQLFRNMYEGLRLTESQLLHILQKHGLEREHPIGKKFDPNRHEAVFQVEDTNEVSGIVMDVQKVGYSLHGRTIRPAQVGVSK